MEKLSQHIESLIFTCTDPISRKEIKAALEQTFETQFHKKHLEEALQSLLEKYNNDDFSFEIIEINGGFQFLSKGAFHQTITNHLKLSTKKRLSKAALESLAIIAYKQPTTKAEIEQIRGVSCGYTIQKLLEKDYISIMGRSEAPGRPLLYGTSEKFMDYFGLKNIKDLPKIKDFKIADNEIGESNSLEETKS